MVGAISMEISFLKKGSIKIKSKNANLVVDPQAAVEADIIFNTSGSPLAPNAYGEALLIQGAGEYEVKGVSIFGKGNKNGTMYSILADGMKVILVSSKAIDLVKDTEDVTAIIIKVESEVEDAVLSLSSTSLLVFYDQVELIKLSPEKVMKNTKVNLKKKDEFTGSSVILTNE
jgi:hypothetical protein